MISMAKSMLVHGRVIPMEEIYREIDDLRPEGLIEIANEVFDENAFSTIIYKSGKH